MMTVSIKPCARPVDVYGCTGVTTSLLSRMSPAHSRGMAVLQSICPFDQSSGANLQLLPQPRVWQVGTQETKQRRSIWEEQAAQCIY